jgi:hypothetical protein
MELAAAPTDEGFEPAGHPLLPDEDGTGEVPLGLIKLNRSHIQARR